MNKHLLLLSALISCSLSAQAQSPSSTTVPTKTTPEQATSNASDSKSADTNKADAAANEVKPKTDDDVQDMSDPLAVFTQAGFGVTNKGINLKIGQTYDTGNPDTAAMNIIELKGILGEQFGWDSNDVRNDSIDSFRWRNFSTNLTNGRATQLDITYDLNGGLVADDVANASYSFIQALPKIWRLNLYPLAGVGAAIGKDAVDEINQDPNNPGQYTRDIDDGYSMMGVYGLVGMYSKLAITDKLWLNYNPFWLSTIAGSDVYEDNAYGKDKSHIFTNELALSYQFTPRFNVRYFANWTEYTDFMDGDHRIEFNYQF